MIEELETRAEVREARPTDLDWFILNFESLLTQYPDEWLAISNQEVVAHAKSVGELSRQTRGLGIRRPFIGRSHPDAWVTPK